MSRKPSRATPHRTGHGVSSAPGVALVLVLVLVLALVALAVVARVRAGRAAGAAPSPPVVSVGDGAYGAPLPDGFIGLSLEYYGMQQYTGANPAALNPVFEQLVRNLSPGQTPVLRLGGDSTDVTWWPVPGVATPGVVTYELSSAWIRTTAALTRALGAKLILGLNLAINSPKLAAAEAQALIGGIGLGSISAFEIGNEPDVYQLFPDYKSAAGKVSHVRGSGYDFADFTRQFAAVRQALGDAPVAGPALGGSRSGWASDLGQFIAAEPGLALVTVHAYPLVGCAAAPSSSPEYPTIAHLLSAPATSGLARGIAPLVTGARAHGLALRVDEFNSVTCRGTPGVSDVFASALWALQTLFALDQAGVAGVNIHMFPTADYAPFSTVETNGVWRAKVAPEYYGLLMFTQAAPPGSQLLPVRSVIANGVGIWATAGPGKAIRVVLFNDGGTSQRLALRLPRGAVGAATDEQLLAPALNASTAITLGGQTFGGSTTTGNLSGSRQTTTITPQAGSYAVTVPAASASLLSWSAAASVP